MAGTHVSESPASSGSRSWVIVAAVLGGAAGALGVPVRTADLFYRTPALFLFAIVLAIVLMIAARRLRHGSAALLLLGALVWLLLTSAVIVVAVGLDVDLLPVTAVVSKVAPPEARLASAGWLALASGALAVVSMTAARYAGSRGRT